MQSFGMIVLTLATFAAAAYAHYRLPFHSANARQLWFSRVLLVIVGLLFGWVTSQRYFSASGFTQLLMFLSAFGVVHVPAAFILFIKRQRKVWR